MVRGGCDFHVCAGKQGSSHLEIIISFVLFVSFTLFLVLTLEPTKQDLLQESILYGVADQFFAGIETNVSSVLVTVTKDSIGNLCPSGQDVPCVPDELLSNTNNISVKEKDCTYYIYSSNEFKDQGIQNCKNNNKQYLLGYIERQEVVSNKTLNEVIKREYYENYNKSKTRFGVPEVVDFAVIIDGTDFAMQKTIPDDAQVISGVYRKKVIYANGSMINRDFIVKVW